MVRSHWHNTRIALLLLLAALVVVSWHVHGAAGSTAAPPECRGADLRASYRARDAGAGHRYGVVRLRNTSDRACVVQGYGGLSYVAGDGSQVGAAADRDPGAAPRVLLQPGERAVSTVDETVAGSYPRARCRPAPVAAFRVYAPDESRSQLVPHRTTGCRNAVVHLLGHTPYRSGRIGT